MTTPSLDDLIGRFERATEGDRELDADLCIALCYMHCIDGDPINLRRCDDAGWLDYEAKEDDGRIVECTDQPAALTASTDAALALVERKLPGWWLQHLGQVTTGWAVRLETQGISIPHTTNPQYAATAPLAICLALLKAIRSQSPGEAE